MLAQLISIDPSDDRVFKGVPCPDGTPTIRTGNAVKPPAETAHMKTESVAQAAPFSGRKQSLIEDARRERSGSGGGGGGGSAGSPGPSRYGDSFVFEEKDGRVTLNVLFTLSNEKNAGFFKTGKIFEVSSKYTVVRSFTLLDKYSVTN